MGNNVIAIAVLAGLTSAVLPAQSLAQPVEVGIQDYKYTPPEIKVKAGTTVKWVNNENRVVQHTSNANSACSVTHEG